MLDVGAQFGESLLPYRRLGWTIYAFEPDPNPSKLSSLDKLASDKVKIIRLAVSDVDGAEVPIYVSKESTGVTSLAPFLSTHESHSVVKTTTLLSFLKETEIERIDFLKIDTEGFDFHVLKGFPWEDADCHPSVILCEFEDKKTVPLGYHWKEMARFLCDQGYGVWVSEWYPIEQYGGEHRFRRLVKFPCDLSDANGWGNLIAITPAMVTDACMRRLSQTPLVGGMG
jgi:FkbM family methyltransferase